MKQKTITKNCLFLLTALLLVISGSSAIYGQYKDIKDRKVPCRIYNTVKTDKRPVIDGLGNEDAWNKVEWTGDFTQSIPKDGGTPSQNTRFRVLYDDENLYFLVRAYDTEPEKIVNLVTRHDQIGEQRRHNCDDFEIFLSTDGDVSTIVNFTLSVSGSRSDYFIRNYGRSWDVTYNPIWEAKTSVDDSGWVGEVRIPINQLNFVEQDEYTWGLLVRRTVYRLQEENIWQWIPADSPGWAHLVGELHGVKGIDKKKHIELLPYAAAKAKVTQVNPEDPFSKGVRNYYNIGLDGKLSLTSNMTMDFTINPDFGQVESDPAVINLTAFENYFEEKRNFFLEGKDIFEYNYGDNKLFYSRRIGQRPTPFLGLVNHYEVPENSTILDAVKVTGRTQNGLSIGILQSTTAIEKAKVEDYGFERSEIVEPMTNYFAARLIKDFNQGQTKIGSFLSSKNMIDPTKFIREKRNENGFVGGVDFLHKWKDKIYFVEGNAVFSHINGDREGILNIKQNPVHYYNRFDNTHVDIYDTTTYLSGHGGRFAVGKLGAWQFTESFEWSSPGLDINDMGFQTMAEYIKQGTVLRYENFKQIGIFRDLFGNINQENTWDYYGNHLLSRITLESNGRFMNNSQFNILLRRSGKQVDIRQLRGGPGLLNEGFFRTDVSYSTDSRKKIILHFYNRYDWSDDNISKLWKIKPGLELKISSNIKISGDVAYTYDVYDMQYVSTGFGNDNEFASVIGHMENEILESTIRINYTITPEISIQYYANWLASDATFTNFRSVSPFTPQAKNYNDRFISINELITYDPYLECYSFFDPQQNLTFAYPDPDFKINNYRSNLVFRWEYRPYSTLFLIWSQDYARSEMFEGVSRGNWNDIDYYNYFLVKFTYLINR